MSRQYQMVCQRCGADIENDERRGEMRERARWLFVFNKARAGALHPERVLTYSEIAALDDVVRELRERDAVES